MQNTDVVMCAERTPTVEELAGYMGASGRRLWEQFDGFLAGSYGSSPTLSYSVCSGKPGWNMKYRKSGKSLCTLYPETDGFTVLLVIGGELIRLIASDPGRFGPRVMETYNRGTLLNGTFWLMIRVNEPATLEDVKALTLLKYPPKGGSKPTS